MRLIDYPPINEGKETQTLLITWFNLMHCLQTFDEINRLSILSIKTYRPKEIAYFNVKLFTLYLTFPCDL